MRRRMALSSLLLASATLAGGSTPSSRTANDGNVVLDGAPEVPERIVNRLERFQNVRSAVVQDWSADGRSIYLTTRFADVPQLHRVDLPGGARHQLTFFREPVSSALRRPGADEVLYEMDRGGDEFYQFHLLDPAGGEPRRLTDGASRNQGPEWSRDGRQLAFTSTRRDGASNDVWVMTADQPDAARLVLQAPDGAFWGPADWHPTEARLLVGHYVSVNDSRVHLLDLASGELRRLAGGDERPAVYLGVDPAFDAAGGGVFLATDASGEFVELARLDLASGALRSITADIPWDVEELRLSDDRRRGAFVVNEDGVSRLYLLDPEVLAHGRVDGVPAGVISELRFSPDGRRLAMSVSTAQTPSDVFTVELGEAALAFSSVTRWTFSEVGGLATASFAVPELVHYPSFDGQRIPAFVYRPTAEVPHPVIVSIHGGPESQHRPRFSSAIQMWLQTLGAAVVAPNVRGSAGYGKSYLLLDNGRQREDSVQDIGALLDWIATQPDLDASRVAVIGGSYGGYMVLASLVHYSDRLRGGVDLVGISNFVTFLENTEEYRRDLRRVEYGDEREPGMRAFLDGISPNRHVARITAPLFVAQGQNDPRVPAGESEQIVAAMRGAGYEVWYMKALDEGHGFDRKPNRDLYEQLAVLFFERHLAPAEAGP